MHGLGWTPDIPDHRDFIVDPADPTFGFLGDARVMLAGQPSDAVDVRKFCSPIEDQGRLGSCVSQAVVGLAEYSQLRTRRKYVDLSRLFAYKVGRSLHGWTGDTGLYIRTGMKALKAFGAPPERYWPYVVEDFDQEPSAFCYAYAQRFTAQRYYRIDPPGRSRDHVLSIVQAMVRSYYPVAFGFVVYSFGDKDGQFPMPTPGQRPYGGHAVVAVGYDSHRRIGDSVGALLIRNSWGTNWGQDGYGWLPYDYIRKGLSRDFWALFEQDALTD